MVVLGVDSPKTHETENESKQMKEFFKNLLRLPRPTYASATAGLTKAVKQLKQVEKQSVQDALTQANIARVALENETKAREEAANASKTRSKIESLLG